MELNRWVSFKKSTPPFLTSLLHRYSKVASRDAESSVVIELVFCRSVDSVFVWGTLVFIWGVTTFGRTAFY